MRRHGARFGRRQIYSAPPRAMSAALNLSILFAAFVDPKAKTDDGDRIQLVVPAWKAILELLARDPDALFKIEPRKMEELIAAKYDAEGYEEVILTPRSRDFGRDVIAVGKGGVVIFDQVKAYSPGNLVSANDVRALMGVVAYSDATKGVVTTTSDFAPLIREDPYIAKALDDGLDLINRERLLLVLDGLRNR